MTERERVTTGTTTAEPATAISAIAHAASFVAFATAARPVLMPEASRALRADTAE